MLGQRHRESEIYPASLGAGKQALGATVRVQEAAFPTPSAVFWLHVAHLWTRARGRFLSGSYLILAPKAAFLQPALCSSGKTDGSLRLQPDCPRAAERVGFLQKKHAQSLQAIVAGQDTQASSQQRFSSFAFTVKFSSPASMD